MLIGIPQTRYVRGFEIDFTTLGRGREALGLSRRMAAGSSTSSKVKVGVAQYNLL